MSGFRPFFKKGRKRKANNTQGGRLTCANIQAYIVKEFGQYYHSDSIYYLLDHMGFS
ncbi:TPA: winged helix-turn-helix domain-containing protein [Vibrio parahaemolyticus]|nr:winged helix-turn-helix domain-containing protein [Vibrio parahaemolyticus]MBE4267364.1 winged helix-turn-helix domain-containing protein [Vibrio parahaemolyticus]MBE4417477.1 winged helix-turn-helix domain-containing protein [Vibrio parahaemolyticus]MBE5136726.1 winged helix-turn-helix domain-containing protein [Vibrio parahaemolyticus]TOQ51858.1 DNA-binding protein [Vibrio parahaemolyticus]